MATGEQEGKSNNLLKGDKLTKQNVELSGHTSRYGMDPESHVESLCLECLNHISNSVLCLSHSQSIAWSDDHILGVGQQLYSTISIDLCVCSCYLLPRARACQDTMSK